MPSSALCTAPRSSWENAEDEACLSKFPRMLILTRLSPPLAAAISFKTRKDSSDSPRMRRPMNLDSTMDTVLPSLSISYVLIHSQWGAQMEV